MTVRKIYKDFVFYIQCKCWNGKELTKSAISEVYAGMHARGGVSKGSIPVVFTTSEASQETRQFAENLGVELILNRELALISHARTTGNIVYANYGVLMKVMLYHYTKSRDLLETLPDTNSNVESMFWWLQKNKDFSSNDLTSILFRIMTGYVDNADRAKMTRTTIKDLVTKELPIDTKGYY